MINKKGKAFVLAYLTHFNATKAAIEAGYSERSAGSIGHELLKKPEISAYIDEILQEKVAGVNEILMSLTHVVRGDIGEIMEQHGENIVIDLEKAKAIGMTKAFKRVRQRHTVNIIEMKNGTTKTTDEFINDIELEDKMRALELLGKYYKIWRESVELIGKDGVPLLNLERVNANLEKIYGNKRK